MHVKTLVDDQRNQTPRSVARSGGRTAARSGVGSGVPGRVDPAEPDRSYRRTTAQRREGAPARGYRGRPVSQAETVGPRAEASDHPVQGATALQVRREPDVVPSQRPARAEPAALRVAPPLPVRAPRAPFVVLVLSIVVAGVVGILVLNIKISENAFLLHELGQKQQSLDINQGQLEKDIAQKEAPGTLAGQATELGMKPPSKPPTFIVLPDNRRLDMPQPAVGK